MKTPVRRKFLSVLLSVVMVVSLLPVQAFAAVSNDSTWTVTSWEDITENDVFAITMSKDGSTWALPATGGGGNGQPLAVTGTVNADGDTLTLGGGQAAFGWRKQAVENGFNLCTTDTATVSKLYVTAANNGVRIGNPQNQSWAVLSITSGYLTAADSNNDTRYIGVYNAQDWRCYKLKNDGSIQDNIQGQTLQFWKLDDGTTPPTPPPEPPTPGISTIAEALAGAANEEFTVKGVVTLLDGRNVYVQDATGGICLYLNAAPTDISLGDTVIGTGARTTYKGLPELTGATYEQSSGLTLSATETTIGALTDADLCTYIAISDLTVTAVEGNNVTLTDADENTIPLYKGVFGEAAPAVGDVIDFTGALGIFNSYQLRNTVASEITIQGETPEPPEPPTPPAPEPTLLDKLTEAPADGAQLVIYHPASGMALTATASGSKLAGEEAAFTEEQLGLTETMAYMTASVAEGVYTFELDGQYLTSGATGNGLSFADDGTSELAQWTLEQQEDGTWYLMNVGAAYNGNHNQALEYYNGFTTYGVKTNNAAYKFEFYGSTGNVDPVSGLRTGDTVAIFNDGNGKAMTATVGGNNRLAGTDATLDAEGKLVGEGIALFTVTVDDEGTISFVNDGKYLTSGATGNSLALADEASEYSLWVSEDAGDGLFFLKNANAVYNNNPQYLEYYNNNFTVYGKGANANPAAYAMSFRALAEETPEPPVPGGDTFGLASTLATGDEVILYNAGNGKAVGNTVASNKVTGVAVTPVSGVITTEETAIVWTVTVNADNTLTFTQGDRTLGGVVSGTYNNLVVTGATYTAWTPTGPDSEDFNYFLRLDEMSNNFGKMYLEYYNGFTLYGSNDPAKNAYGITFYKKGAAPEVPTPPSPGDTVLQDGEQVVIYSPNAEGSLGIDVTGLNTSLSNVPTAIADGAAVPENGAFVFTVGVVPGGDKTYYTFCAGGKYLATNDAENLFLQETVDNYAQWYLTKRGNSYIIYSREAKYNNSPVCIEFFAGMFSGWTFKATDAQLFLFDFYPLAEGINTYEDVVNEPKVDFMESAQSVVKQALYRGEFTLDDLTPLEQIASVTLTVNGEELTISQDENNAKHYSFSVPETVTAQAETLTITVAVTYTDGSGYEGTLNVEVIDRPLILNLSPAPNSETGEDKTPLISADVLNADESAAVELLINGQSVQATFADGTVSYQSAEPMPDGRTSVSLTVTRTDGVSGSAIWSFVVGESTLQLYFGQLHAHTTYSDGSGTLPSALDYIRNIPESANIDFVAFTDHSNYFDTTGAANPEGALYDMSLASQSSQDTWNAYKSTVAAFNADPANSDLIALAGFEMTWSGGPGHINTFNTPGIVSRNNSTLNNKTNDAGMKAYYALLDQPEGLTSISQFNHPGKTFGNFTDFSYWDAVTDSRIYLVEVGNGEGQIGAGGYYPSYEQYTMALDKGWHVAPTNNQDNHKGRWGNANDARDVILTEDFSEEGIYEAIRQMRLYATEDKNLELFYTVNDQQLGSIITEVPEALDISVQFNDPDGSDVITKVEVIVNSGKVVHTWSDPAELSTGSLNVTLDPDYSYYYIRVTEQDGDLAVTAPVWVGETLKIGIASFLSGTALPVTDEELTLTTTVFNSEGTDATLKSIVYTAYGAEVLGADTTERTVPAAGTLEIPFAWTPTEARVMTITVTVVLEQDGKEFTFTKDLTLDVQDADKLVYIGIDASHYNEYVAGNYKDSMGNFAELASGYAVRTVYLESSDALIAACGNEKFAALIFTAPSRRLAAAQADPRTYSADELAAITAFNAAGGMVIVAGWSDYYENYASVQSARHMAETQNDILAAIGSHLRISDDATHDDELNGGQTQRLYFNAYNMDNPLMEGIVVDPEHPNDRTFSEVFSHYGGASIYAVDDAGAAVSALPGTVDAAVYGHATTYSRDSDNDGLGGASVPRYAYAENDSRLLITASETLEGQGLVIVSGAAFMSNFEVQADVASGSSDADQEMNYSNYKFCENIVKNLNEVEITPIAEVQAQTGIGYKYTIEGVVTSNASGYDKDTAFFDCIYVQDDTAGICCFPVAGNFKVGDRVRITGTTDFYQGEAELQVLTITLLGDGEPVEPAEVTAAQINDLSVLGSLVTLKGTVKDFELENGLVQTILVKDDNGRVARVFIDGYITTDEDVQNLARGCKITATGLSSYDDTWKDTNYFPRIRVRDRADVVCAALPVTPPTVIADDPLPLAPTAFDDVPSGYWAEAEIEYVAARGVMIGVGGQSFAPELAVTRGTMAQILFNLEKAAAPAGEDAFPDIAGKWYADAANWAASVGLMKGTDNGFDGDEIATREQIVTILHRYAKYKGYDVSIGENTNILSYEDAFTVSGWAMSAMCWACGADVLIGRETGMLAPDNKATRAELAVMLKRFMLL